MQHAIITGASRGIGRAIAHHFLSQGWQVTNLSRHTNPEVNNITLDFADPNWPQQQEAIKKQVANANKICLIHNAGTLAKDSIQTLTPKNMRRTMDINLIGPLQLNQIILPHMQAGSSIIYIGSTLSEKAVKNTASYAISKHAVVGLMRASCQDLDNTGIHTCCVCPGFTDTEMLRDHLGHDEAVIKNVGNMVSAHRLIEPQEIAELTFFCANHPVINGAVLHANLGQIER